MIINTNNYEKSNTGSSKLLLDVFNTIKESMGTEHVQDKVSAVLSNKILFDLYLEQYNQIKSQIINITQTPCEQEPKSAIKSLTEKVQKRDSVSANFSIEMINLFTDEQIQSMSIKKIEALALFSPEKFEILTIIGAQNIAHKSITIAKLNVLMNFSPEIVEFIGAKNLMHHNLTVKKLNILLDFSVETLQSIGKNNLINKNLTIEKLEFLKVYCKNSLAQSQEKIKTISGKYIIHKNLTVEKLTVLKEFSLEQLKHITGPYLVHENLTTDRLKIIKKYTSEKIIAIGVCNLVHINLTIDKLQILECFSVTQLKALNKKNAYQTMTAEALTAISSLSATEIENNSTASLLHSTKGHHNYAQKEGNFTSF